MPRQSRGARQSKGPARETEPRKPSTTVKLQELSGKQARPSVSKTRFLCLFFTETAIHELNSNTSVNTVPAETPAVSMKERGCSLHSFHVELQQ